MSLYTCVCESAGFILKATDFWSQICFCRSFCTLGCWSCSIFGGIKSIRKAQHTNSGMSTIRWNTEAFTSDNLHTEYIKTVWNKMHVRRKRSGKCHVKRLNQFLCVRSLKPGNKTPLWSFFSFHTIRVAAFCQSKQRQSSSNAALQPAIPNQQHNQLKLQSKHTPASAVCESLKSY